MDIKMESDILIDEVLRFIIQVWFKDREET
jgi:hypothetical protein